jgi:hypothetical protein
MKVYLSEDEAWVLATVLACELESGDLQETIDGIDDGHSTADAKRLTMKFAKLVGWEIRRDGGRPFVATPPNDA